MKAKSFVQKAARWAEKKGFKSIKASCESYETPKQFIRKGDEDDTITPHVTAMRNGRKNYIEVATKTEDVQAKVSKWKLLSALARRTGGKLFLLAPRGHKAFTERLIERHLLAAEIVYLK